MPLDLEPLRAGVAMTWHALDERERMVVLYVLAWLALGVVSALHRRSRENLRRDIVEELGAHAGGRD